MENKPQKLKKHAKKRVSIETKRRGIESVLEGFWQKFKGRLFQLFKSKLFSAAEILKRRSLKEQAQVKRRRLLRTSLLQAGIEAKPELFSKWVFVINILANISVAVFLLLRYAGYFKFLGTTDFLTMSVFLLTAWLAIFLLVLFILWLSLYLSLDFLRYKRSVGIDEVLPDFLLLTSANIRAGMPIDRALWYAVRPRFGVLAKEIELAAKETMSGDDLETALKKFADKYDSLMLKNTISLLIEGMNAGGEIGELLNKISLGIQDNMILKKEMSASVSAYAIFIAVSALIVAPLMFALSSQLLNIIAGISESISLPSVPIFALAILGGVGVTQRDFLIFAFTNLFFTSLISAMITSVIQKGDIKAGLKYIPIFTAVSLFVFFIAFQLFSRIFGGIV
jgi:Flp pilus assembly protein TadB